MNDPLLGGNGGQSYLEVVIDWTHLSSSIVGSSVAAVGSVESGSAPEDLEVTHVGVRVVYPGGAAWVQSLEREAAEQKLLRQGCDPN